MDAEEFDKYMFKEKRDRSYLMAFASCDFIEPLNFAVGDVHVSEDLLSHGTWEIIDIYFSKVADLMFIYRNDGKKLTDTEIDFIHEYVVDDMEEYMSEGEDDWRKSIHKHLTESKQCLILSYSKSALEMFDSEEFWSDAEDSVYEYTLEEAEKIAEGETDHDKTMTLLTDGPEGLVKKRFDDVYKRRKK